MRLLFVADGRSPIALNWIGYFVERGHEVHLVSTFTCAPELELASQRFVPVAFSALKRDLSTGKGTGTTPRRTHRKGLGVGMRTCLRQWFGPVTLPGAARRLEAIIQMLEPDLVHAMRIPYEGMLAAMVAPQAPLLVSVWGNDFTYHAPSTSLMARYTRRTLGRCQRAAYGL